MRLIDADALIKWADESVEQYGNRYSTDMLNMFGLFKEVIDNAPTVEQKYYERVIAQINPVIEARPKGTWIIVKDNKYGNSVKCPFCNKEVAGTDLNFCVKCGADMRGKKK